MITSSVEWVRETERKIKQIFVEFISLLHINKLFCLLLIYHLTQVYQAILKYNISNWFTYIKRQNWITDLQIKIINLI